MNYIIRDALPTDIDRLLRLFPRLAEFEIPERRNPDHLWQGDAAALKAWAAGDVPDIFVKVAVDPQDTVLGVVMVRLRSELLSYEPSAHLEVIVVAPEADGQGIGKALIHEAETAAYERGARSITLHVFAKNERARHVYEKLGYSGELIRYIKHFE
ncbi:MAG: GNAT family N-acetyltransferase [Chloroflexota bacterium]